MPKKKPFITPRTSGNCRHLTIHHRHMKIRDGQGAPIREQEKNTRAIITQWELVQYERIPVAPHTTPRGVYKELSYGYGTLWMKTGHIKWNNLLL